MKKTLFFLLSLLMFVSCYDDTGLRQQMQDFEDRLAGIAGTMIAPISSQITGINTSIEELKEVDADLKSYIDNLKSVAEDLEKRLTATEEHLEGVDTLKSKLEVANAALEDLVASDVAFDKKLADLQSYLEDNLKSSKDWAKSAYATLDQYDSLQTELSKIKATLDKVGKEMGAMAEDLGQQLSDAIAYSESSMKAWVNKKLAESYYDMAAVDANLAELEKAYKDADESILESLAQQQAALDKAKQDITEEYEKAISDAVKTNDGVLNLDIADAIKTAQEELQAQLEEIGGVLETMEGRLAILESKFINRIQSLVYVPEYTDGKAVVLEGQDEFELKFLVTPVKLASAVQTLWQVDTKVITANLCYSEGPASKPVLDNTNPLKVKSVTASEEGLLTFRIKLERMNADLWKEGSVTMVYIHITDGNNDRTSEMITLDAATSFEDHLELPISAPGIPSGSSANCYIISKAGKYTLKAVKGHSSDPVGPLVTAEVLWESTGERTNEGDLISSVSYHDGKIGFTTAETFREGNAVIAAKGASGNILWSWHIWMTDEPESQNYYRGAGVMMDRNLGATSATPGEVGSLGLFYQWGRKDPFLGSSSRRANEAVPSTISWPEAVQSDETTGTVDYTLAHPTTFVAGNEVNSDWQFNHDNTLWTSSKSIYDPCPVGWHVPAGGYKGAWTVALGFGEAYTDSFTSSYGIDFSTDFGAAESIWYPASGLLGQDGDLAEVGDAGYYWSVTHGDSGVYALRFKDNGRVDHRDFQAAPCLGYSVRCVKGGHASSSDDSEDSGDNSGGGSSGSGGGDFYFDWATDITPEKETANSYIVNKMGMYKFKAYKGNSQELAGSPSSVDPVGEIAKAEVLWESFGASYAPEVGELISDVVYDYPYIGFTTASTFREGNAVIAAKDASGNILWSWHIWLTDYPVDQIYYNSAGTLMDRNLGATSATPGEVGTLGLMYQWGRKDPFLGSSSISENKLALSTITWPDPVQSDASVGTVAYAVSNPTTFITAGSNDDWQYEQDYTRWQSSKSKYDPCPVGWRVPDGGDTGVWADAYGAGGNNSGLTYDSTNGGINFFWSFGNDFTIWYPTAGYRSYNSASLNHVGVYGRFWSHSLDEDMLPIRFVITKDGTMYMNYSYPFADAYPVRCLKDGSRRPVPNNPGNTPDPEPEPDPTPEPGEDLSNAESLVTSFGTANSYIVSRAGTYKFPTVKGNSLTSVGAVAKAEVLWETFGTSETPSVGDLVSAVSYSDGYISFKTADSYREGNALIAAKDASDNTLWSWHIWMTDKPAEQVYYNGAGTMMDRNLGATSATPGDAGALGLLYQWGRKDPFLGSSSISEGVVAASTITWPYAVQSDATSGTIDYAVANPMTFIVEEQHGDWQIEPDYNRWQSSKTIYDPCPVGWRVPDGGENGVWVDASGVVWYGKDYDFYDELNKGVDFTNVFSMDQMVWYPSAHCRAPYSGQLGRTYNWGVYWSCTYYNGYYDEPYSMGFTSDNLWNSTTYQGAYGLSVRCLKDGSRTPSQDNPAPTPDSDPTPDPVPDPTPDPAPPPAKIDYVDEYGINHGPGIKIDDVIWAPVNCGYHATDYQWGKLYQWGRKYGQGYSGTLYNGDRNVIGKTSDVDTPTFVSASVSLDEGQSLTNKNVFFVASKSTGKDWLYPQDNTLWNAGTDKSPIKTANDPCPEGWRVPTDTELSSLWVNSSDWTENSLGQTGYWFTGSNPYSENVPKVFLPAAGRRYWDGSANFRGDSGEYCSSGTSVYLDYEFAEGLLLQKEGICGYADGRAFGNSVRCVQE